MGVLVPTVIDCFDENGKCRLIKKDGKAITRGEFFTLCSPFYSMETFPSYLVEEIKGEYISINSPNDDNIEKCETGKKGYILQMKNNSIKSINSSCLSNIKSDSSYSDFKKFVNNNLDEYIKYKNIQFPIYYFAVKSVDIYNVLLNSTDDKKVLNLFDDLFSLRTIQSNNHTLNKDEKYFYNDFIAPSAKPNIFNIAISTYKFFDLIDLLEKIKDVSDVPKKSNPLTSEYAKSLVNGLTEIFSDVKEYITGIYSTYELVNLINKIKNEAIPKDKKDLTNEEKQRIKEAAHKEYLASKLDPDDFICDTQKNYNYTFDRIINNFISQLLSLKKCITNINPLFDSILIYLSFLTYRLTTKKFITGMWGFSITKYIDMLTISKRLSSGDSIEEKEEKEEKKIPSLKKIYSSTFPPIYEYDMVSFMNQKYGNCVENTNFQFLKLIIWDIENEIYDTSCISKIFRPEYVDIITYFMNETINGKEKTQQFIQDWVCFISFLLPRDKRNIGILECVNMDSKGIQLNQLTFAKKGEFISSDISDNLLKMLDMSIELTDEIYLELNATHNNLYLLWSKLLNTKDYNQETHDTKIFDILLGDNTSIKELELNDIKNQDTLKLSFKTINKTLDVEFYHKQHAKITPPSDTDWFTIVREYIRKDLSTINRYDKGRMYIKKDYLYDKKLIPVNYSSIYNYLYLYLQSDIKIDVNVRKKIFDYLLINMDIFSKINYREDILQLIPNTKVYFEVLKNNILTDDMKYNFRWRLIRFIIDTRWGFGEKDDIVQQKECANILFTDKKYIDIMESIRAEKLEIFGNKPFLYININLVLTDDEIRDVIDISNRFVNITIRYEPSNALKEIFKHVLYTLSLKKDQESIDKCFTNVINNTVSVFSFIDAINNMKNIDDKKLFQNILKNKLTTLIQSLKSPDYIFKYVSDIDESNKKIIDKLLLDISNEETLDKLLNKLIETMKKYPKFKSKDKLKEKILFIEKFFKDNKYTIDNVMEKGPFYTHLINQIEKIYGLKIINTESLKKELNLPIKDIEKDTTFDEYESRTYEKGSSVKRIVNKIVSNMDVKFYEQALQKIKEDMSQIVENDLVVEDM